jgi:hypothetical protein
MKRPGKSELWQAASLLLCLTVTGMQTEWVGASEFSGGWITGPLFSMSQYGWLFFLFAIILTFFYQRVGAVIGIAASVLCLPFYLYFLVPGLFRSVFIGEWSVPLQSYFSWDTWAISGMLTLAAAIFVCSRSFSAVHWKTRLPHLPKNM